MTDWAEREVASLDAYLEEQAVPPEQKDAMKSQIRGNARRNGPVYRFKLTDGLGAEIEGYSSRYRVVFRSAHDIEEGFSSRITDFLRSLGLGNRFLVLATLIGSVSLWLVGKVAFGRSQRVHRKR